MAFEPESKYALNIFEDNHIFYDWNTIYVGYLLKRLKLEDLKEYALDFAEKNQDSITEPISELILKNDNNGLIELLRDIFLSLNIEVPTEKTIIWNLEWSKWRYCILSEINKHISDARELLQKIEEVYADFGYPEDMNSFIYYMPALHKNLSLSPENAQQKLLDRFHKFLQEEREKIVAWIAGKKENI